MRWPVNTAGNRAFRFSVAITALTVSISKNGGNIALAAGSIALTGGSTQWYTYAVQASDVNTLGALYYVFTDSVLGEVVPDNEFMDEIVESVGDADLSVSSLSDIEDIVQRYAT